MTNTDYSAMSDFEINSWSQINEDSSRDKLLFSGHKTESQVLIYDRKLTISPSLDIPVITGTNGSGKE